MLRISQRNGCLFVEGRVAGPWVAELSRAAEAFLSQVPSPTLDLSGVSYVDQAGAELLRALDGRMAIRASGFITEILRRAM